MAKKKYISAYNACNKIKPLAHMFASVFWNNVMQM